MPVQAVTPNSRGTFDSTELKEAIAMTLQDQDFSLCLQGLTTLRLITANHSTDQPNFFTLTALIIESGAIERLNRIILSSESEFCFDDAPSYQKEVSPYFLSEEEPESKLISAKLESIGILINLSFGTDGQIQSLLKRGCIDVFVSLLGSFESMAILQKAI